MHPNSNHSTNFGQLDNSHLSQASAPQSENQLGRGWHVNFYVTPYFNIIFSQVSTSFWDHLLLSIPNFFHIMLIICIHLVIQLSFMWFHEFKIKKCMAGIQSMVSRCFLCKDEEEPIHILFHPAKTRVMLTVVVFLVWCILGVIFHGRRLSQDSMTPLWGKNERCWKPYLCAFFRQYKRKWIKDRLKMRSILTKNWKTCSW